MSDIAVLTRPEGSNQALAQRLTAAGWQVRDWPALALTTEACPPERLPRPQDYDLAVFVSGNAARHYLEQLHRADPAGVPSWPASCLAATVGPSSAAALRATGCFDAATVIHPGPDAPSHDSEALWEELRRRGPLPRRVLIVRGTEGRDWLADRLREAGAEVLAHAAYRRTPAQWDDAALAQLQDWRDTDAMPVWLLTSGEGIAAVLANVVRAGVLPWWRGGRFIVTHPVLAQRLERQEGIALNAISVQVSSNDALFEAFVSA
ncbi:uroporphyrinogen-III synthase [Bordetella sp. N]|uniref:uroporphyrinogen-III synthase n=1 Tax=Bordetella sp. N TaxID=1746199 RepID=UPI00070CF505|nr:uroporphyrinogen-III synthase [Bordetella sp. N]ALM83684.1 uroporphyrinogen-III synthase [Bordetella sp. N]